MNPAPHKPGTTPIVRPLNLYISEIQSGEVVDFHKADFAGYDKDNVRCTFVYRDGSHKVSMLNANQVSLVRHELKLVGIPKVVNG
jgi:hypothetical protein